jgi:hypothetical protein
LRSRGTSWNSRAEEDIQLPHPAPDAGGNEDETPSRMGATFSVIKARTKYKCAGLQLTNFRH